MKLLNMLAAIALSAPALAQVPATPPAPPPAPVYQTVKVVLSTRDGAIVLELEKERAPITTANFLRYVDQKRLDGATVYRAATAPNSKDYGLIQFGTKNEAKRTLPAIAHEPTSKTGLSHKDGTISLARAAPGTGAGDFFIMVGDTPSLDADPKLPGDNQGFAAFGRVVEGMELVRTTLAAATDPNKGEGALRGQYLVVPLVITTARRVN